jgi:pyruvate dehydrogenase E2 component (dihydrolipoamide acetyltransferase)/2-oxoisovalerate dehydrogenase E2 component (dihydrolipoyl transacylase)
MDFALPELGEGVYEAEVVRWLVKPGDAVKRGQSLLEVMTDKATMEVPSPFIGTVKSLSAEPGQQVKVGATILQYDGDVGSSAPPAKREEPAVSKRSAVANGPAVAIAAPAGVKASPSVRHMARKLGVDLSRIRGSGPGGRVLIDDLATTVKAAPRAEGAKPQAAVVDVGVAGTRVKLAGLRKRIAERMVQSTTTIPHYTVVDEVDVTDLSRLRSLTAEHFAAQGIKLTYLAFVIRAAVLALKEVPIVNATLDEQAQEIVLHDHYHVGFAVTTPGGLMVPVIHDADKLDLGGTAREIERLSTAARSGKAKREELTGGTFTVTSIGNIGGLISTPIINPPEVGILGIGKVVKRPVYDEFGNIKPAEMVYVSLTFDHRAVDGAVGATFGNALAKHLRHSATLLLK